MIEFITRIKRNGNSKWILVPAHFLKEGGLDETLRIKVILENVKS